MSKIRFLFWQDRETRAVGTWVAFDYAEKQVSYLETRQVSREEVIQSRRYSIEHSAGIHLTNYIPVPSKRTT